MVGRLVAPVVAPALVLAWTARGAPWAAARTSARPWAWTGPRSLAAAEPHRQVLVATSLLQVAG